MNTVRRFGNFWKISRLFQS